MSSISGEFFVMHGADRKGEEYLGAWAGISDRTGIIVIAPEFSIKDFGEVHGYNLGNVESIGGLRNEKAVWSFSVIENIFDKLRSAGLTSTSYNMFGHSAGGQFVHRMLTFLPEARVDVAIAANAGFYTFLVVVLSFHMAFAYRKMSEAAVKYF